MFNGTHSSANRDRATATLYGHAQDPSISVPNKTDTRTTQPGDKMCILTTKCVLTANTLITATYYPKQRRGLHNRLSSCFRVALSNYYFP